MICTQKGCDGQLYCHDTREIKEYQEGYKSKKSSKLQQRQRRWCCVECGARYVSCEVLNPIMYSKRPMPKSKLKSLGIIEMEVKS